MTEYVAVLPFMKYPVNGNSVTELSFMSNGLCAQTRSRKFYAGCVRSTQNVYKAGGFCFTNLKVNHYQKVKGMKCYCLGTLMSTNSDPSEWIPVIDQVLLMSSIFLTHMAGVIPADGPFSTSKKNKLSDSMSPNGTLISGSDVKNDKGKEFTLEFSWETVKEKLTDSITAIDNGTKLENEIKSGQTANQPSSLSAIAEGPRFRLMLASFHWLKNEVDNISKSTSLSDLKILQKVFSEILQRSSLSICTDWLKDELLLRDRRSIKEFPPRLFEKLKGDDSVLQTVKKSGKEDLYTELLYILRFNSLSQDSRYDNNFFASWGVSVLEDLVITLSDGIASIYLELISVDSDMSNDINDLGLNLCALSTRALQRLRNEVSLNQWFVQNMETVVSMYEDRFDLRVLQSQRVPESSKANSVKFDLLKKLGLKKSTPLTSPLCGAVISCVRVPVKRTKELRGLVGWRYYFSLYLELTDIAMPFVRTLAAKISDAVSFFLVCLIGRSLGLIYTGIRQSLRWK